MHVSITDMHYAYDDMNNPYTYNTFGGREWERAVGLSISDGFWHIMVEGLAPPRPHVLDRNILEATDSNTVMRKLLTLVFGAIYSACGKRLPSIEADDYHAVAKRYPCIGDIREVSGKVASAIHRELRDLSLVLDKMFSKQFTSAPISYKQKIFVGVCVLTLLDCLRQHGVDADKLGENPDVDDFRPFWVDPAPEIEEALADAREGVSGSSSKTGPKGARSEYHGHVKEFTKYDEVFLKKAGVVLDEPIGSRPVLKEELSSQAIVKAIKSTEWTDLDRKFLKSMKVSCDETEPGGSDGNNDNKNQDK